MPQLRPILRWNQQEGREPQRDARRRLGAELVA
jgi:hypothetical protein